MKLLIEKLDKKHLEKLEEEREMYPAITGMIEACLSKKTSYMRLTLEECLHLCSALGIEYSIESIRELFQSKKAA